MWEAIEMLQQGESLNIQDMKTNLFWEFIKLTSHDGETMESYYTRFYKLMNEMTRNNLTVTTMQVNVQFFQQLQPEWSRFVTIVKQQHKLDEVSYHKLFDIMKQYQNDVNELRAERLARNANPLALEIAKLITPPSETASEEENNPEQAQRDKDMQKNLALIAKTVNVAGTREKVGSPIVQKYGIQCFNCREFGHFAKEYKKPKRVKDSAYHKEKMLLCKQAEQGVLLLAEQYDWLADMDEEVDKQELEAHYSYIAKIQEIQKQLKKANTTLAQELKECKTILAETSKSLGESISVRDSCLVTLQTKQTEFEKYKAFNDRTIDYEKLKLKQKTKVITDLKLREEHDIKKMVSMEKQLKFLNEVVYKRSQSIQTIHMMAPKVSTYNGRPTFANP
nr:hypothetical protein [Tanacetum cinerariifolium]